MSFKDNNTYYVHECDKEYLILQYTLIATPIVQK